MRRLVIGLLTVTAAVLLPAAPASAALNGRLVETQTVNGTIIDVSTTALLWLDQSTPPALRVSARTGGATTTIPAVPGRHHVYGWLTSRGAAFIASGSDPTVRELFEWSGGSSVIDLGSVNPGNIPVVTGSYLVWVAEPGHLYRRNVDTDITVPVASDAGFTADADADGDVVYTSHNDATAARYRIMRYHSGVTQQITADNAVPADYPIVDGANVVYRDGPFGPWDQNYAARLFHDGTHISLSTPMHYEVEVGSNFDAAGGWVAYRAGGDQGFQFFVRDPAGVTTQLSGFGFTQPTGATQIVAISPTGLTAYAVDDHVFLGAPGQTQVDIAAGVGRWASHRQNVPLNLATYVDGRWLFAIGGKLYELSNPPTAPAPKCGHRGGRPGHR